MAFGGLGVVAVPEGDPGLLGLGPVRGLGRWPGWGRSTVTRRRPSAEASDRGDVVPLHRQVVGGRVGRGQVEEADAAAVGPDHGDLVARRGDPGPAGAAARPGPSAWPALGPGSAPGPTGSRADVRPASRPSTSQIASSPSSESAAIRRPSAPKTRPCCGRLGVAIGGRASTSRIDRKARAWSRSLTRIAGSGPSPAASAEELQAVGPAVGGRWRAGRRSRASPARPSRARLRPRAGVDLARSRPGPALASAAGVVGLVALVDDPDVGDGGRGQDQRRGGGRDGREAGVPAGEPPEPADRADPAGPDRLVGQEPGQVVGQVVGGGVAVVGPLGQGLQEDRLQVERDPGVELAGAGAARGRRSARSARRRTGRRTGGGG